MVVGCDLSLTAATGVHTRMLLIGLIINDFFQDQSVTSTQRFDGGGGCLRGGVLYLLNLTPGYRDTNGSVMNGTR